MQQRMEIIKFNEKLPMRLYCYRLTELKAHWHRGIEIILILKGDCSVIVNDQIVNMKEDDIMESFFGSFKREALYRYRFKTEKDYF